MLNFIFTHHLSMLDTKTVAGLDWSEYNLAALPYERIDWMIRTSKDFLEEILRPIDPTYECIAFRAANWCISPSQNIIRALVNNNVRVDTSVFKYGRRQGPVFFDYSLAYSEIEPWPVKEDDICSRDDSGQLWEVPIYCEQRWVGAFLNYNRINRALMTWRHSVKRENRGGSFLDEPASKGWYKWLRPIRFMANKHAWKADFNQCTGKQLIQTLERAQQKMHNNELPLVLIGHPESFLALAMTLNFGENSGICCQA